MEAINQSMFFDWLALARPNIRALTFAIPNGGSRDAREGANLKRQGVTAGVFDVFVSVPSVNYNGLYIEFKHGRNKLTSAQKIFQEKVLNAGFAAVVCYNFDEAMNAVEEYLKC